MKARKHSWMWLAACGNMCVVGLFLLQHHGARTLPAITERTTIKQSKPIPTSTQAAQPDVTEPEDVSLVRLTVTPERYHGKRVRTIGFVTLFFEGTAIYSYKEDAVHGDSKNGLWLTNAFEFLMADAKRQKKVQPAEDPNYKYCIVEGTFDMKNTGHMGLYSGSIKSITRLEVWSDPTKPQN